MCTLDPKFCTHMQTHTFTSKMHMHVDTGSAQTAHIDINRWAMSVISQGCCSVKKYTYVALFFASLATFKVERQETGKTEGTGRGKESVRKRKTERSQKHQTAMPDEKGEIEREGLREERNQGNDLDDDSAVKERADPTERAGELARERETWSEVGVLSERRWDSMRERERGIN